MSYLRESVADLFISYRRVADEGEDKWVAGFRASLLRELKEMVGDVDIWRDKTSMGAGAQWEMETAEALRNAAVFLAVISRTYFDAKECRREFDEFMARCSDTTQNARPVLVPIFKQPPKDDPPLPVEIQKVNHPHSFFQMEDLGSHRWRELGPNNNERDFRLTIARLAQDLTRVLEDMKGLARRQSRGKVFLAAGVGRHLDMHREVLRSEMVQRGYLVVPEHEYMWSTAGNAQAIADDIHGACLCVHIVGRHEPGRADEPQHVREQLDLAQRATQRPDGPRILVWVQPATATSPAMQPVVDHVLEDLANVQGFDYWDKGFEEFRGEVTARLPVAETPPRAQPRALPQAPDTRPAATDTVAAHSAESVGALSPAASAPRKLLLLAEDADIDAAQAALAGPLGDAYDIEPRVVSLSGAQPKDTLRLAREMAGGAACVVYWGGQPLDWLQDVLDMPALAVGRERLAVYVDGPPRPGKASFAPKRATVVSALQGANPAAVAAFAKSAGLE